MQGPKLEGVADPHEVVHRRRRKAEAEVKIELLVGRDLVRRARVDEVLRASALRKLAAVFDEGVPAAGELPVNVEAGLAGQIAPRAFGPVKINFRFSQDRASRIPYCWNPGFNLQSKFCKLNSP